MLIFPEVRHIPVKGQDETLRVPLTSIITCLLLQFSSPRPGFVITAQVIQILEILEVRMNYELDLFGTIEPRQTIAEKIHQYGVKAISDCGSVRLSSLWYSSLSSILQASMRERISFSGRFTEYGFINAIGLKSMRSIISA